MIATREGADCFRNRHPWWRPQVSGYPAETFTVLPTVLLANPGHGYPQPSKPHRCLIRTGLAARVAHLISVGGMATANGGIGVEPVIQGGND